MIDILKGTKTVLLKDIKLEMRSREFLTNTFMFAFLVIIIFNFAFEINSQNVSKLASGILWISFIFAGTIGLSRSFIVERENDCIYGLLLTPVDRTSIFWGKFLGNLILLSIVELFILPIFVVLYNINIMQHLGLILLTFFLGNIGFMSLGTVVSAMSVNMKAREILMPVLLLPLLIPLIIWVAQATSILIENGDLTKFYFYIKLVTVYDIVFFVIPSVLFEYILDEL